MKTEPWFPSSRRISIVRMAGPDVTVYRVEIDHKAVSTHATRGEAERAADIHQGAA